MSPKVDLSQYVTVAERIEKFYAKYPDGSIISEIVHDDGKRVVMKACAHRTPFDTKPGVGHAEEIRGEGMVNKTSALENCETSSWGRAIAALGFEVKKGIASREEVEQAQAEEKRQQTEPNGTKNTRAEELRNLVRVTGLVHEAGMKLTSWGVERLEELSEEQGIELEEWLSSTADQKAQAA